MDDVLKAMLFWAEHVSRCSQCSESEPRCAKGGRIYDVLFTVICAWARSKGFHRPVNIDVDAYLTTGR
jgi:hypothetical protein